MEWLQPSARLTPNLEPSNLGGFEIRTGLKSFPVSGYRKTEFQIQSDLKYCFVPTRIPSGIARTSQDFKWKLTESRLTLLSEWVELKKREQNEQQKLGKKKEFECD